MIREFRDIDLKERNSFHVSHTASKLIEFESEDDLREIFGNGTPERWCVLSGGNNIVFTKDYDGVLITPTLKNITIISEFEDDISVKVDAGVEWDELVEWAVDRGLWGIENLSLIPGKAGAAPVQNIGAYGVELKDVLESVEMFCVESCTTLTVGSEYCDFAYRDSIFKHSLKGRVIITSIVIKLSRKALPNLNYRDVIKEVEMLGGATLINIRNAICKIRRSKLPDTNKIGNAGSFFKNPIVENSTAKRLKESHPKMPIYPVADDPTKSKLASGWLIDRAGLKGFRDGEVGIHEHQALVLVNFGEATGKQIMDLAERVQSVVFETYGVEIQTEVNIL